MKVAIVGGGIGGMALALSLVDAGIGDVDVYESAAVIRELGVGINVLPHGVRELVELGLLDELSAVGIPTSEFFYYSKRGQQIYGEPLGVDAGYSWPQFSIHRRSREWMESGAKPPVAGGLRCDPAQSVDSFDDASWEVPGTFQIRGASSD
jgi:2-polyprenyl-6-methoxyphenol hydroxylase-like FAD-dependent oxidoreductase